MDDLTQLDLIGSVLVVEDDRVSRDAMLAALTMGGYHGLAAESVEQAMELLDTDPSHVLLDLMLADGNGTDVLEHIRRKDLPVRVAVITGASDPMLLTDVIRLQPDALYRKPVDFSDVARWLDR